MALLYSWTEDGLPERCTVSRVDSRGMECYHCGSSLDGPCVRLDAPDGESYLMHRDCAYNGCGGFDRVEIDAAMGDFRWGTASTCSGMQRSRSAWSG